MGAKKVRREPVDARRLQGFKYFELLDDLFERLRPLGTERDKAGNRELFYDQYAVLFLLYYFNPALSGLRSIQQFTTLEKVQKVLGVRPTALGAKQRQRRLQDRHPEGQVQRVVTQFAEHQRASAGAGAASSTPCFWCAAPILSATSFGM